MSSSMPFFSSLFGSTTLFTDQAVQDQLAAFRTRINDGTNTVVRFWVESGASFGHQAATANLVYRMGNAPGADNLNFGYTGTMEVYYETAPDLVKLQALIPELLAQPPQIGGATVTAILWTGPPASVENLGFCGGGGSNVNYLAKLNVQSFLLLQPYRWPITELLLQSNRAPVNLGKVPLLGPGFENRIYFVAPNLYQTAPLTNFPNDVIAQIVQEVCTNRLNVFGLLATYSIKSGISRLNASATYGAALICGSVMSWQKRGTTIDPNAKPVIIMNFDDFGMPGASEGPEVTTILSGGVAPSENGLTVALQARVPNADVVANFKRREAFFKSLGTATRFTYINYPQTLLEVTEILDAVAQLPVEDRRQHIIFLQVGRGQQTVFNYAIYHSTLPAIFEGQNTTNTAINMGVPYMQVPAPNMTQEQQLAIYPSVSQSWFNPDRTPLALSTAAQQINSRNTIWPERAADAPCVILGDFYRRFMDEDATGAIHTYFTQLQAYYGRPSADKFCLAVAYLSNVLTAADAHQQLLLAAPENPLNALYAKLQAAVTIGQPLDLIPGILGSPDGNIAKYILNFVESYSGVLSLTVETFTHDGEPPAVTGITLEGPSTVFASLGINCTLTVVFTAPDNALQADITFTQQGAWIMPGVPWIVLSQPFAHMLVPNGSMPVQASIGGFYPALESSTPPIVARLEIAVTNKDIWAGSIDFETTYPGIASAFQMMASVNLVQALPSPFNILTDLGVSEVKTQYNYAAQSLDSILVVAKSNSQNLKLFNTLTLSNIAVTTILLDPVNTRILSVGASADFNIGTTAPATITVSVSYPGFTLQGELTNGVLTIENIFSVFLPGYSLALPSAPSIDQFSFAYTQASDYLNITLNLNIEWTFTFFGNPLFLLQDVGFAITRTRGANTGFVTAQTVLLPASAKIGVTVGAYYLGAGSWQFQATQTSGTVDLSALLTEYLSPSWVPPISFPKLAGLSLTMDWENGKAGSFEFKARTASPWAPIPALPKVTVTGDALIGYKFSAQSTAFDVATGDLPGAYGTINANLTLWNIELKVSYNFDPKTQKLCVTWLGITGCLTTNTGGDSIAVFTLGNKSIGEMVEMFVSWATGAKFGLVAPWNLLDEIKLSAFSVTYNFTKKTVDFNVAIGPMDFGVFKINGLTLAYDSTKTEGKVAIKIDGSFVWAPNDDSMAWDPTDPSSTPAPPGGGNKYLDLRLLALGQHVTVAGLTDQRQVEDVIKMLRDLQIPSPPEIPVGGTGQPVPASQNSWFVAFDFGVLKAETAKSVARLSDGQGTALALADDADDPAVYFMQLSIVFNDPILYALQIALDGPMAKIFAGLNFQIMYRQVSDTVGCYSAQIALPNIMRTFQIGVASITLPVFGIDVYTNGDFQVDIGFPWQMNFSRSFSIEVIVLGVPVLGSAGFYFGKLSSATTDLVPRATNGWFNPVLVFGFGAQIGLGKSIEAGILSAGFSLTVFGIIEGVIARWLPYTTATPAGNKNSLQDGYFFSLTGTFGLQGRLYGTVNFAIVKATVDVAIAMYVKFTFTAYADILISASASVRISVSLEINLGLFSISISFSFSATVSASFTLSNPMGTNAPWQIPATVSGTHASGALRTQQRRLLRVGATTEFLRGATTYSPVWTNLEGGSPVQISGWMAPVLSVAGDTATVAADQTVCYVVNFFLPVAAPLQTGQKKAGASLDAAAQTVEPRSVAHAALERTLTARANRLLAAAPATFDDLAVRVLEWVVAAGLTKPYTPASLQTEIVTAEFLQAALDYLSSNPIDAQDVDQFLNAQTQIVFTLAPATGQGSGVFFPAPPGTTLSIPQYPPAGGTALEYAFGSYNSSSADYVSGLNTYFNQLLVEMQQQKNSARLSAAAGPGPSVASFTFGDYFSLIGRQAIQALLDGLKNFKLPIDPALTVTEIVKQVNDTGSGNGSTVVLTTAEELFAANAVHTLSAAASAPLTIHDMLRQTPGLTSFNDIAALPLFASGVTGTALATANVSDTRILAPSSSVTYPGKPPHIIQSGDSLATVAASLDVPVSLLLSESDVLANKSLLSPLAVLAVPDFRYSIAAGDTLQDVAARFSITLDSLAAANGEVAGLFDTAQDPNLNVPELSQYQVGALIDEAHRTLALQNLGAMTSRFYLSGLRLPTSGLTPNYPGLFVSGTSGQYQYPADLGLFALTGQAFALPAITSATPAFNFSLTRGAEETWLSLGAAGGTTLTYSLVQADDLARYTSLKQAAQAARFQSGMTPLAPIAAASTQPARFPLAQRVVWQTPVTPALPRQTGTPATPQPALWQLPNPLINLPASGDALARFRPMLARTDPAAGNTVEQAVNNFGFGTLVSFSLRRTAPAAGSPASARFYELIGATQSDTLLLERLLDRLQKDDSSFQQMLLLYPPSSTGSEVTGWQSDDSAASLMGIGQVNLSTESRPPSGLASAKALAAAVPLANVINKPTEFLRLLWEASITRSGGFYLSYTTGIGGGQLTGLPDRIFAAGDVATVAVLALFVIDGSAAGQSVPNYMNVVATNEALDLTDSALVAESVPVSGSTRKVTSEDTLAALAAAYYTDPGLLAVANPTASLSGPITVPGGRYQVPPVAVAPGGDLAAIAAYFNTTAQAIQQANPQQTAWPNPLPAYTGLLLPPITITAGTGANAPTFASLSAFYHAPIPGLAAANALAAGLFTAGQTLLVTVGPFTLAPQVQAGVAGFQGTRTAPASLPAPTDPNFSSWGSLYLQHVFNLLGYRVADSAAFSQSGWGLPLGPAAPESGQAADKIAAPQASAPGDPWIYSCTLPYPRLVKNPPAPRAGLPTPASSPYLGVGQLLQFDLGWQDIFGNRILSELTHPQAASELPASPPSEIAGYTDLLIGPGQWPGIANAFRIVPDLNSKPKLELLLAFDESPFSGVDAPTRIQHALSVYEQVLFQLHDPNGVTIGLFTSLTPAVPSLLTQADAATLVAWIESIYTWLASLPAATPGFTPELTLGLPLDSSQLNPGQIFRVTASLSIGRNALLVNGELATAPGFATTNLVLTPWTGPLTDDASDLADYNFWRKQKGLAPSAATDIQRDIAAFSAALTAAFSALPDVSLHVATGADSNAFSSDSTNNLWVVQLGVAAKSTAISYAVNHPGAPKQFAPRPISNKLVSRPATPIIGYITGKVIALTDPSTNKAFANVDLDQWMQFTLTQIDALLTPRYVAPALILRKLRPATDPLQPLLDAKKKLAAALATAMIPVFKGDSATDVEKGAIQEVFNQSLLGQLSQFYAVKTGIQFDTTVNAAIQQDPADVAPPRLYGNIVSFAPTAGESILPSNISLSSPKLNLTATTGAAVPHLLSLLLSSTTTREASLNLNLSYSCQYIEHEISKLAGIEGYQPSTWLSFADNANDPNWPLNSVLGQFDVPLVLRAFPETPTLTQQDSVQLPDAARTASPGAVRPLQLSATGCSQPGTFDPLASATLWNYAFTYTLAVHSLNDAIHGTISFNTEVSANLKALAAGARDLFDNLAEFNLEYPAILADLDTYLAPLEVGTTDTTQIDNASAAIASAANLIQWIADSASSLGSGLHLRDAGGNQAGASWPFTLIESSVDIQGDKPANDVLCVTVSLPAAAPAGIEAPLVDIDPETYARQTYGEPDPLNFRFVYTDAAGNYLSVTAASAIAARTLILPSLNVLQYQDAEASIYLTRNEVLAGKAIAEVFVYTTPTVAFPDPLLPTVTGAEPVNLALLYAVDGNTPVARTLACQLTLLYQSLFAESGTSSVTLTLTAYYEYSPSDQIPPVRLPVFLMPPIQVAVRTGGTGITLAGLIDSQVKGYVDWFQSMQPSTQAAGLFFDLTVMSDLASKPMPILHLSGLYLPLAYILPALG